MVDYSGSMKSALELRDRAEPAKAPATGERVVDLDPRLREAMQIIVQTLPASQEELRKAVAKRGYSDTDFDTAFDWLLETSVSVRQNAETVPPPFDPWAVGQRAVGEMKNAEDGAWTGQELRAHFGLTPATLHKRRVEHRIVYWRDAKHDFHYPKWQFTPTGAILPGVQEVLQIFRSEDEWGVMSYFLGKRQQLGDRRPLDLLRQGEKATVLAHAKLNADENTW